MLLLGYILVTCYKNNIVTLYVTFVLYRRNKTCLLGYYQAHSKNLDKCGKNPESARRKPNYHTKCLFLRRAGQQGNQAYYSLQEYLAIIRHIEKV